jgi:sulfur-oxidizing protein SoxY
LAVPGDAGTIHFIVSIHTEERTMKSQKHRRAVLKAGGGMGLLGLLVAAGFLPAGEAFAQQQWNAGAFGSKNFADAVKALGGAGPTESKAIQITAPDIAENGLVVPIAVTSGIPKTESIAILVEKNPNLLSAVFDIPAGTEPFVSTRVKLAESTDIYALVKADGKFHFMKKEIKVTLGGCGG